MIVDAMGCGICGYYVLSLDTEEGLEELMALHMFRYHPGRSFIGSDGRLHSNKSIGPCS